MENIIIIRNIKETDKLAYCWNCGDDAVTRIIIVANYVDLCEKCKLDIMGTMLHFVSEFKERM